MVRVVFLIFVCVLQLSVGAWSQTGTKGGAVTNLTKQTTKGKTYALIIGVSRYQYPESYKTLAYADVDGRTFYNFLVSTAGGSIPKENIDTLFNEQATHGAIMESLLNMKDKLQPNDLFYFYFSGHGDAYNAEKAFLLAYDSPSSKGGKEKNHYLTFSGAIDIGTIKIIFKEMAINNANVVFISDACRTNELAGGTEGQSNIFKKIMEEDAGEIRLTSCSSNQVSFEGPQWGNGRGLFSYYLINGLTGMADNEPEDGKVTVDEIYSYVKANVKKSTYDTLQGISLQTPQLSCKKENCEAMVMNKVNKTDKDRLALYLKNTSENYTNLYAYNSSKGTNVSYEMKKIGKEMVCSEFYKRLNDKKLIGNESVMETFRKIEADSTIPIKLVNEFRGALSNALMTDVAKVINTYMNASQNNNLYSHEFFHSAYLKLCAFKEIANPYFYNATDLKVNLLFLEGHSNWKSMKSNELLYSLSKIDSAIQLKPEAAYLYNIKGLLHLKLKQFQQSETALKKGVELAPNWIYPYHNLGSVYSWLGMHDTSLVYYFKALHLDTTFQTSYLGVANEYNNMNKEDSCMYYLYAGLKKDPKDPMLWNYLGTKYYDQEKYDKAMAAFRKSYSSDTTTTEGYEGAMRIHLKNFVHVDSILFYLNKIVATDPSNPAIYQNVGQILLEFDYDTVAKQYFEIAVLKDTMNVLSWNDLAYAYTRLNNYSTAEGYLYKSITIDSNYAPTYSQLGNLYFLQGKNYEALNAYQFAQKTNPYQEVYYFNIGYVYKSMDQLEDALTYFLECENRNTHFPTVYPEMAQTLALLGRYDEALVYLDLALKNKQYATKEEVVNEKDFQKLRKKKGFKKIVSIYFKN